MQYFIWKQYKHEIKQSLTPCSRRPITDRESCIEMQTRRTTLNQCYPMVTEVIFGTVGMRQECSIVAHARNYQKKGKKWYGICILILGYCIHHVVYAVDE